MEYSQLITVIGSWNVGLSTIRIGSSLGSTHIQPKLMGCNHHQPTTDREENRIRPIGVLIDVERIGRGWGSEKQQ